MLKDKMSIIHYSDNSVKFFSLYCNKSMKYVTSCDYLISLKQLIMNLHKNYYNFQ